MAKDLNRSVKIYIDNSDAMKKASELKDRINKLQLSLMDLNQQGKKDSDEYKKNEASLKKLTTSYDKYKAKVNDTERVLRNLSGATRKELEQLRKDLRGSLAKSSRDTDSYKAKVQALTAVEKQLELVKREQNGTMGRNASMWSRMADGFNKYFGLTTSIIASITGLSYTLRKLSEDVAKMDDVYSDVMKTTGMTRDQVLDLNDEFKQMDTRTARTELNNLARDAGKLGLQGRKDILDFVEAGNQINVSLGEDLGEGAIKNIGKMTDVYTRSTKELERMDLKGKMLAIGSAINQLGASSTASEAYMVEFTQRLGGVASQAGISIQSILGYASALDQSGQAVEMSATALQNFIMKLMGNPAKFAKLAGIEVNAFNKLLKEDTNEAIKQVLTALNSKGGFQALIPIFQEMGLDGARAVGVLSALATNIDKVNTAQQISNSAFSEGVSITDEYAIKNNNLNAKLDKSRKAFNDAALVLGEHLNPMLLTSTNWTTYFIKALPIVIDWFAKYKGVIGTVALSFLYYYSALKIVTAYQSAYNTIASATRLLSLANAGAKAIESGNTLRAAAAQKLYYTTLERGGLVARAYLASTTLLSAAKLALTGRFAEARKAMQLFQSSVALNPAAIGVTAVMTLVTALGYLWVKYSQLMTAAKAIKEVSGQYNEELAKEKMNVDKLFSAYRNSNPESAEHKKIKDQIISQYGAYLQGLIDEKGELTSISYAYEAVNTKIREQIMLKIKNAATEKIVTDGIKTQQKGVDSVVKNVTKQLKLSDEVANNTREKINKIITSFTAEEGWEKNKAELGKRIKDYLGQVAGIQADFNMDNVTGFGNRKSLNMEIESLTSGLYRSQLEINKVSNQYKGLISQASELKTVIKDQEGITTPDIVPPLDKKGGKELVDKQKEELNLKLEKLETLHQSKLLEIKKEYQKGTISNQTDFEILLFSQEQTSYLARETALKEFLEKVKDETLKSDIEKQLADVRNKRLDAELKLKASLEQIILDADPELKEKTAYENRLRQFKLFGRSKESLLFDIATAETESEKLLLQQRYDAFILLEKEHLENMVKIRKEKRAKLKDASEETFTNDFKERKNKQQEEILKEEQQFNLYSSFGAYTDIEKYNAEVNLQQKRIALIKEELEARQKAGLDTSRTLQNLADAEMGLTNIHAGEFQRRKQLYSQYANEIGTTLGGLLTGQQDALQAFADQTLDILFDTLTQIIQAEIIKVMAAGTGAIGTATAGSMATPGSIMSFGAQGFATAAILTAAITGAMTLAKTALKGLLGKRSDSSSGRPSGSTTNSQRIVTPQQASGKYDVIGEQDGKLYRDVPFAGLAQTGIVTTPTLIAEQGAELVVSAPHLKALQNHMNYPLILQAIQDVRFGKVPQRAEGKYDQVSRSSSDINFAAQGTDAALYYEKMVALLSEIRDKDLDINYYQFENARKKVDNARNLGKRK